MPTLRYISVARFPTEKAHGLQIAQNCEAFADVGYDVQLWASKRKNTSQLMPVEAIYPHYGIKANFVIKRISSIDLYRFSNGNLKLEKIAFFIHIISYCLVIIFNTIFNKADVYYSRDKYVILALSLIVPREKLVYEAHQFSSSGSGAQTQQLLANRVGSIITITTRLGQDFIEKCSVTPEKILVAHDGIRKERFMNLPDKTTTRQAIGWDEDAFIVGFVGRLQMLEGLDKGVGTLLDALAQLDNVSIGLVGGPEKSVADLQNRWQSHGLSADNFLYAGQVPADDVPRYLSAFDICAMPHPFNTQFAYYTSPLKLFEYMASERPIVASDLPSWADVVTHEQTALLVPASDVDALANAIKRLRDDKILSQKIADNAHQLVMNKYTWIARAQAIKAHLDREDSHAYSTAQ
ncbi:MAG: hypothetical protein Phog2KO_13160 [Phototrophicaceae bacterium]